MYWSGLRISTSASISMSLALITAGPSLQIFKIFLNSTSVVAVLIAILFKLRIISVTSSLTPLIVENSCFTSRLGANFIP